MSRIPKRPEEVVTPSPVMGTDIANAIVTSAPLTAQQLEVALEHYEGLNAMLQVSGPRFVNAKRDAVDMHNRALTLLRQLEAREAAAGEVQPATRAALQA